MHSRCTIRSARRQRSARAHSRGAPVLAWTANDPRGSPPAGCGRCRRDRLGRPGDGVAHPGYTARAVKRLLAAGLFVIGLAVAGGFSGPVIADITTSTSSTTTATTTAATTTTTTTTTTVTTTTTAPSRRRPARRPRRRGQGRRADVRGSRRRRAGRVRDALSPSSSTAASSCSIRAASRRRTSRPPSRRPASAEPGHQRELVVVTVRGASLRAWVDTRAAAVRASRSRRDARLPRRPAGDQAGPRRGARSAVAS